jgi:probable addiction module antidote protein
MLKTTQFDAAKYFMASDDQADLLNDALQSGHAGYIAAALGVIARARGMKDVAGEAGVTREALYKSLSADGDPRLSTSMGVAKALGVTFIAQVQPVGFDAGV